VVYSGNIEDLFGVLRRAGYKATRARRAVIEFLAETPGHATAPEIVAAVGVRAAGVGRASVYRTLELLTQLGLVQVSSMGGSIPTYVFAPSGHHHHLVCTGCGKTIEFEECVLGELEQRLADTFGFRIESHLMEVFGRCPDCQPTSK
jgi:Fur family ferric uptake transcriptional regulator